MEGTNMTNEFPFEYVLDSEFIKAFNTLKDCETDIELAYRIIKIERSIKDLSKQLESTRQKLLSDLGQDTDAFKEAYHSLLATPVVVDKLSLDDLKGLRISARNLEVLLATIIKA